MKILLLFLSTASLLYGQVAYSQSIGWVRWSHERETQKYDDGGKERTRYVDEWSIFDAYESFAQCKKEALSGLNDIARAMKGSVVPMNSGATIIFTVQISKEDTKKTEESVRDLGGITSSPYGRLVSRSGRFESICLPAGTDPRPRVKE